MAYSQSIIVKLLPSDTGLAATLLAKIYSSANVLRVTTSAGVGWTELGGGEYQFTYASFDSTDAYIKFFNGATYQTSTTVYDPTVVNLTGIALTTDVTASTAAIEAFGGTAPWTTATGFSTPGDVSAVTTNVNAHTDVNLDAKVSTRAIPTDVTTAVTNINAHTDVNLDAKVSTRMATFTYTAPDNATIGTTGSTVATNLNATITSRASATDMATVLADLVALQASVDAIAIEVDLTPITNDLAKVIKKLDAQINN